MYFTVPNRHVGWNKSVGRAKRQNLINMLDGINMLEGQNVKSSKYVGGENLLNIVRICEGKYLMYIFEGN